MSRSGLSVAVVGGGIGGLAAALSLLEAGCDVQVFEQAPVLTEVGAGIQISPNASRLLHLLGSAQLWHGAACVRRLSISAAGTTAAPCNARSSARRSRPSSARPTTI